MSVEPQCPIHQHPPQAELEQLETGERTTVQLAEHALKGCPRHNVGCTPHECHGALMEKEGFPKVGNSHSYGSKSIIEEAKCFLTQYDSEVEGAYLHLEGGLDERIEEVKREIAESGTYVHTFEELQFGCRLAWRNSGRCIMRKVSFTLNLRDCRHITTAEGMFDEILDHLDMATNGGAVKPVISVFPPKTDGKSAPVRIWNAQLISYAGYQRPDGSILGDPARVGLTALAVKLGWEPPDDEYKSDYDLLPLIISDESTGHDKPEIFKLPERKVLEVPLEHPEHEAFVDLGLRWYALPCISNMGSDIGGVFYQTCPFNGWYSITEISRNILDKQRYDMGHSVSIACDIPRTILNVWKDDVQLQVHRAILHSFAKHSVSIVDHHTASNSFKEFYKEEIKQRGKCSADWIWLVPPAGGSMTSVFHQEMFHFIQKPQYRPCIGWYEEYGSLMPSPVTVDMPVASKMSNYFDKKKCIYDNIVVCFGSETGTALKFANIIAGTIGDLCVGPVAMDSVPALMTLYSGFVYLSNLLIIATSTFGKGCPPNGATKFLPALLSEEQSPVKRASFPSAKIDGENWDYAILALGNSAYVNTFVHFAIEVDFGLKKAGCTPVLPIHIADELKNQDEAFTDWEKSLYGSSSAVMYQKCTSNDVAAFEALLSNNDHGGRKVTLAYAGTATLSKDTTTIRKEMNRLVEEHYNDSWASHTGTLLRSLDLFSFKAEGDEADDFLKSGMVLAGDHIALYPENQKDSVESVLRLCVIDDYSKMEKYRKTLTKDVDLGRPLQLNNIQGLLKVCTQERAQKVLDLMIANSEGTCDDPNSTTNNLPTTEMIINQLPPGTIPIGWVLEQTPAMMPRFFSISSVSTRASDRKSELSTIPMSVASNNDKDRSEVTITQSAFHFGHSNKAGTTSKWLRLSLNPGDKVEVIFSTTNFHLPEDQTAPVIMICAGSGIAPFRSFWMAKRRNPMHLFFGCQRESEVPFKSELDQLKTSDRLTLYPAYSRGEKALYVQDRLLEEAETVSNLLKNHGETTIYVCGTPELEYYVREKLIMIIGGGNDVVNAAMRLARMKVQNRYVTEVYGKSAKNADSPMGSLWEDCLSKTIHISSSLDRVGVAKPRNDDRVNRVSLRSSVLGRSPRMRLTVTPVSTSARSWKDQAMQNIRRRSIEDPPTPGLERPSLSSLEYEDIDFSKIGKLEGFPFA